MPPIFDALTIEAADAAGAPLTKPITINAQGQSRIFQIGSAVVTIDGRMAGFRFINGKTPAGQLGLYGGGAIIASGSILTLTNCEFTNNRAAVTEGDPQNWGGALRVDLGGTSSPVPGTNSLPTVTIDRCTFRDNYAGRSGEPGLAA